MSGLGLNGYRDRIRNNSEALQPNANKAMKNVASKTLDVAKKISPSYMVADSIAKKIPKNNDRAQAIKNLEAKPKLNRFEQQDKINKSEKQKFDNMNRLEKQASINKKYNQ